MGRVAFVVLLLCAATQCTVGVAPWTPGPHKVSTFLVGKFLGKNAHEWQWRLFAPEMGDIKAPLFTFVTGFGGNAPVEFYHTVLTRVASYGYFVIGTDLLHFPAPRQDADGLNDFIAFLKTNLTKEMAAHSLKGTPDFDNLVLGGQSAGCHITTQALNDTCGTVKAHMIVDPVDGEDPFGFIKNFVIRPGHMVPFKVPTLLVRTGFDPKHKPDFPACAPDLLSNDRFYHAMYSPIWMLNATDYGHADCLDQPWPEVATIMCPKGTGPTAAYHNALGGWKVSFLKAVLGGDASSMKHITDVANAPVTATLHDKTTGYDPAPSHPWGFCHRT